MPAQGFEPWTLGLKGIPLKAQCFEATGPERNGSTYGVYPLSETRSLAHIGADWKTVSEAYLSAAVDSDNTRRAYRRHLDRAAAYFSPLQLHELTGADLAAYRAYVVSVSSAPATHGQALAALRSFLSWSGTMAAHRLPGDVVRVALRTPRTSFRKPYNVLSEAEIVSMLDAASGERDRALLRIMLGAGLRVAELVALDVSQVLMEQEGGAALFVSQGKGRKDRLVPIQPDLLCLIRRYLSQTGRRLGQDGPLFRRHDRAATRRDRGRLTARAVGDVVAVVCKRAGIDAKRISPHSCRHTFAIRNLRLGAGIVEVSKLLGHSSIATTQRYLDHLSLKELRAAVAPLPGGDA